MGYKEWRQRQLDRVDGMTARADERVRRADQRVADLKVEQADRREQATADALDDWCRRRAAALREDHDDLLARAGALGIPAPSPDRQMKGRLLSALGELVVADGAGGEGGTIDSYEGWRDRIVVEESMIAKQARGESLTMWDRAALRIARGSSKS